MEKSKVREGLIIFWGTYFLIFLIAYLANVFFFKDFIYLFHHYPHFQLTVKLISSFTGLLSLILGHFYLIPLLKNKKLIIYIVSGLSVFSLVIFIYFPGALGLLFSSFANFFFKFTFAGAFRLFLEWYQKRDEMLELETQSVKSTLAMLRMQINPHFLFNTLNNIDSLIKEDPSKASQSLIKLSDIMRYMLYENEIEKVEMKKYF